MFINKIIFERFFFVIYIIVNSDFTTYIFLETILKINNTLMIFLGEHKL